MELLIFNERYGYFSQKIFPKSKQYKGFIYHRNATVWGKQYSGGSPIRKFPFWGLADSYGIKPFTTPAWGIDYGLSEEMIRTFAQWGSGYFQSYETINLDFPQWGVGYEASFQPQRQAFPMWGMNYTGRELNTVYGADWGLDYVLKGE